MRRLQRRFPRNSIRNADANNDIEPTRGHDTTTQLENPLQKSKRKILNNTILYIKLALLISIRGAVYLLKHDDNVIDDVVNKTSKYVDVVNKTSKYVDVVNKTSKYIDVVNKTSKYIDVDDTRNITVTVDVKVEKIVYLAGLVRDAMNINPEVWKTLLEINCDQPSIGIHMVAGNGFREVMEKIEELKNGEDYIDKNCAPFMIVEDDKREVYNITDNSTVVIPENRIDRISILRDYQRMSLRRLFIRDGGSSNVGDVVILADLDLVRLPKTSVIKQRVSQLQKKDFEHDVLCALGIIAKKKMREPWYYDTFSTVLLPDTFVHPLSKRMYKHHYEGEDERLVRSDSQYGDFTQGDIFKYFVEKGKEATSGVVSVRSCFGGLTMYRANVYFNNGCQYRIEGERKMAPLMKYAGSKDERPCEHVVFHDCLKRKGFEASEDTARIALDPTLISMWR